MENLDDALADLQNLIEGLDDEVQTPSNSNYFPRPITPRNNSPFTTLNSNSFLEEFNLQLTKSSSRIENLPPKPSLPKQSPPKPSLPKQSPPKSSPPKPSPPKPNLFKPSPVPTKDTFTKTQSENINCSPPPVKINNDKPNGLENTKITTDTPSRAHSNSTSPDKPKPPTKPKPKPKPALSPKPLENTEEAVSAKSFSEKRNAIAGLFMKSPPKQQPFEKTNPDNNATKPPPLPTKKHPSGEKNMPINMSFDAQKEAETICDSILTQKPKSLTINTSDLSSSHYSHSPQSPLHTNPGHFASSSASDSPSRKPPPPNRSLPKIDASIIKLRNTSNSSKNSSNFKPGITSSPRMRMHKSPVVHHIRNSVISTSNSSDPCSLPTEDCKNVKVKTTESERFETKFNTSDMRNSSFTSIVLNNSNRQDTLYRAPPQHVQPVQIKRSFYDRAPETMKVQIFMKLENEKPKTVDLSIFKDETTRDVLDLLTVSEKLKPRAQQVLYEEIPKLNLVRFFEDQESIFNALSHWPLSKSKIPENKLSYASKPNKYQLIEQPETVFAPPDRLPKQQKQLEILRQKILDRTFPIDGQNFTPIEFKSKIYMKEQQKKRWVKKMVIINANGLFVAKGSYKKYNPKKTELRRAAHLSECCL